MIPSTAYLFNPCSFLAPRKEHVAWTSDEGWSAFRTLPQLVENGLICRFRPTGLELSLGLVENDTRRGVFFTHLTGCLRLEVAVNKAQAAQYWDSGVLPEAWPETFSLDYAAAQGDL